MAQITECPSCGKKGLVQRGPDRFQCLSCNFNRDLSRTQSGTDIPWILMVAVLFALLLRGLYEFGSSSPQRPIPNPEVQSWVVPWNLATAKLDHIALNRNVVIPEEVLPQ